jgi:hypothetical protein
MLFFLILNLRDWTFLIWRERFKGSRPKEGNMSDFLILIYKGCIYSPFSNFLNLKDENMHRQDDLSQLELVS